MNCSKGRDSLDMVKQWILEHACKHRMEKVIKAIFRRGIETLLKWKEISEISINPAFMFVTLVECFQEMLHNYIQKKQEIMWNNNFSILIADLLEDLYKQNRFISFKMFINIITRLKLLEIMQLMKAGKDSPFIVRQLNKYFPHWNKTTQEQIQKSFNLSNAVSLRKARKVITVCRRFILGLLINDDRWKKYAKNNFEDDMKSFALVVSEDLKEVMNILRPELPLSPIEQILNGANDDLSNSSDPFVQMLLEHLHVGMGQDDFLILLASLDPETESQVNPTSLAGILDIISDSASIASDVKVVIDESGGESDTPTEVYDNVINGSEAKDMFNEEVVDLEAEETVVLEAEETVEAEANGELNKSPISDNEENIKDWDEIVSPSEEEQSNESESKLCIPNLEHQLVIGCGRPCLVKLNEHMV
ncbi:uncharacterized protein LOC111623813 isoform X2 [Centruroides sculpturatus]|uniref:uncharacterized protein LOC111623813 isoform X2 n=1 Tax=Centruroides sculpturatus TaxID=218467 RepID=UPI000C6EDE68|nr:uncharacterized protein LOC111623813 isoform X2 [Centruroides sculpturatus]